MNRMLPVPLTLQQSAAQTAGGSGTPMWVGTLDELFLILQVSAVSGAGTMTVYIDVGVDGSNGPAGTPPTKWTNIASFPAQTAVTTNGDLAGPNITIGRYVNSVAFGGWVRVRWTQTFTSVTFSVQAWGK